MESLRLTTFGFDRSESELLQAQLKMLNQRTSARWGFVANDAVADVGVFHGATPPAGFNGVKVTTGPRSPGFDLQIEWPIRLFKLLELLETTERLRGRSADPAASSPAERLSSAEGGFRIGSLTIFIDTSRELISANCTSEAELLTALGASEWQSLPANSIDLRELSTYFDRKALLWSLALRETSSEITIQGDRGYRFKLGQWPAFGQWETHPWMLRAAALYAREPSTVRQGALVTDQAEATIASFLRACELCSLGLKTEAPAQIASVQPPKILSTTSAQTAKDGGMLGAIRRYFGLRYSNSTT